VVETGFGADPRFFPEVKSASDPVSTTFLFSIQLNNWKNYNNNILTSDQSFLIYYNF
jgi:hypothetical protein